MGSLLRILTLLASFCLVSACLPDATDDLAITHRMFVDKIGISDFAEQIAFCDRVYENHYLALAHANVDIEAEIREKIEKTDRMIKNLGYAEEQSSNAAFRLTHVVDSMRGAEEFVLCDQLIEQY